MNSLFVLSSRDFSIQIGKKGKLLCINPKGIVVVLFYSDQCPHCGPLLPIFRVLSKYVNCQVAIHDIGSDGMVVAKNSKMTVAPVTSVPQVILYVNQRPFMKYEGERKLENIVQFIKDVIERLNPMKKAFFADGAGGAPGGFNPNLKVESSVPAYDSGMPYNLVCDSKNSCYLTAGEINSAGGGGAAQKDCSANGTCNYFTAGELNPSVSNPQQPGRPQQYQSQPHQQQHQIQYHQQ